MTVKSEGQRNSSTLSKGDRIPSTWLIQIRIARQGLMYQYPDQFSRVVSTFLETVRQITTVKS